MNTTEILLAELRDELAVSRAMSAAVTLLVQRTEAPTAYSTHEAMQQVEAIANDTNFAEYYEATKVQRGVPLTSSYEALSHDEQVTFRCLAILELVEEAAP